MSLFVCGQHLLELVLGHHCDTHTPSSQAKKASAPRACLQKIAEAIPTGSQQENTTLKAKFILRAILKT